VPHKGLQTSFREKLMHTLIHTVKHANTAPPNDSSDTLGSTLAERWVLMGWLAACVAVPMWLALRF
jgi:hypothetical protein